MGILTVLKAEGHSADTGAGKFALVSMGGRAEGFLYDSLADIITVWWIQLSPIHFHNSLSKNSFICILYYWFSHSGFAINVIHLKETQAGPSRATLGIFPFLTEVLHLRLRV
jgi:hypothetical protein